MPEPCKFLSLDSFQKRFLWTHEEVDLVGVVGLELQEEDAETSPGRKKGRRRRKKKRKRREPSATYSKDEVVEGLLVDLGQLFLHAQRELHQIVQVLPPAVNARVLQQAGTGRRSYRRWLDTART